MSWKSRTENSDPKAEGPESIRYLRDEVVKDPGNLRNRLLLGWALYDRGYFQDALIVHSESRELFPDEVEIYYALAMTQKMSGRVDDAVQSFQMVLRLLDQREYSDSLSMIRRFTMGHINMIKHGKWEPRINSKE
ncbi:MAG: hypothetical protein GTO18_02905 [Anaerolineales bacterium]|nr:hypothetical protein [Anaerolineales bacterium]